jgi:hypothetical protein
MTTKLTHRDLVMIAANWITSQENRISPYCEWACRYAFPETVTYYRNTLDVYGFGNYGYSMIEVKTSHADFLKDQKKDYIKNKIPIANFNWYFCPKNIIKENELPQDYGLVYYVTSKKECQIIKQPKRIDKIETYCSSRIIASILRRLKVERVIDFRNNNKKIELVKKQMEQYNITLRKKYRCLLNPFILSTDCTDFTD